MTLPQTHPGPTDAPRFTVRTAALMVLAAAATFLVAYAVGGVFGRAADEKLAGSEVRAVPAHSPSGTADLSLRAQTIAFDTKALAVPADRPFRVRLENEDAGIFHNIAIYRDAQATDLVARGALFDGPRVRDYSFEAIPAGAYYFQCDLHPAMNGILEAVGNRQ
jgi:plastocyanin